MTHEKESSGDEDKYQFSSSEKEELKVYFEDMAAVNLEVTKHVFPANLEYLKWHYVNIARNHVNKHHNVEPMFIFKSKAELSGWMYLFFVDTLKFIEKEVQEDEEMQLFEKHFGRNGPCSLRILESTYGNPIFFRFCSRTRMKERMKTASIGTCQFRYSESKFFQGGMVCSVIEQHIHPSYISLSTGSILDITMNEYLLMFNADKGVYVFNKVEYNTIDDFYLKEIHPSFF